MGYHPSAVSKVRFVFQKAHCCRLGDDRKGETKGREAEREGAAATRVRDADGPHRGGGCGDKWTDARAVQKVEAINLSDAFQPTGPVCLLLPIKTLPNFRVKCNLFIKFFYSS